MCEFAEQMLHDEGICYEFIDIDESPDLIKRYHVKVPVLTNGQKELAWPFDTSAIQELADG